VVNVSEIVLSETQIIPVKPRNGLIAFVSFVMNGSFYCSDIALYSRLDGSGYRIVYPDKVLANNTRLQVFHPISKEAAEAVEKPIFQAYEKLMNINQ